MKFRAKFELLLQNLFLSIFANHSKSDVSTGKLSSRLKLISFYRLKIVQRDTGLRANTAPSYKGQNSHNFKKLDFTYGDFPCHLRVNRDNLALINRLWKCERAKD